MIKLIVAGCRDYDNYFVVHEELFKLNLKPGKVEIVSGHASGVDSLGERFAKDHDLDLKLFPADWDGLGKKAGYVRNEQMAQYGDALLAFWDGKSKGTKHMIDLATKHGLKVKVIDIGYDK
jgi:hypothetical protein